MRAAQDLVATNHRVRAAAFLYCFAVLGIVLWERGAGTIAWTLLVLQFIVYPHLVYWRARHAPRPVRAELDNLFIDAGLLGVWCAALGFPTWITFSLVAATTLNAVVNRGAQGFAWSLACSAAGAAVGALGGGVRYSPATSELVTLLCAVGVLGYTTIVGYRGPHADPAPRRRARRPARERAALPADRRERGRPHRHGRPGRALALHQPLLRSASSTRRTLRWGRPPSSACTRTTPRTCASR